MPGRCGLCVTCPWCSCGGISPVYWRCGVLHAFLCLICVPVATPSSATAMVGTSLVILMSTWGMPILVPLFHTVLVSALPVDGILCNGRLNNATSFRCSYAGPSFGRFRCLAVLDAANDVGTVSWLPFRRDVLVLFFVRWLFDDSSTCLPYRCWTITFPYR